MIPYKTKKSNNKFAYLNLFSLSFVNICMVVQMLLLLFMEEADVVA